MGLNIIYCFIACRVHLVPFYARKSSIYNSPFCLLLPIYFRLLWRWTCPVRPGYSSISPPQEACTHREEGRDRVPLVHWRDDRDYFGKAMSRNRFQIILSILQFYDGETRIEGDKQGQASCGLFAHQVQDLVQARQEHWHRWGGAEMLCSVLCSLFLFITVLCPKCFYHTCLMVVLYLQKLVIKGWHHYSAWEHLSFFQSVAFSPQLVTKEGTLYELTFISIW